jgi:hypothetical protein
MADGQIAFFAQGTFWGRLVAESGKIKLLREALNSLEVARATVQDIAGLF